jgi:hypothetical protein
MDSLSLPLNESKNCNWFWKDRYLSIQHCLVQVIVYKSPTFTAKHVSLWHKNLLSFCGLTVKRTKYYLQSRFKIKNYVRRHTL